jgi:hypothetical protein
VCSTQQPDNLLESGDTDVVAATQQ